MFYCQEKPKLLAPTSVYYLKNMLVSLYCTGLGLYTVGLYPRLTALFLSATLSTGVRVTHE